MTQALKIWLATRRLSRAQITYFRLRGDFPFTREPWSQAELRLEQARLRAESLRMQLAELQGAVRL